MSINRPSPTEEWFKKDVLNRRHQSVVAWSFFIQSCLIWIIKIFNISISSVFDFQPISITTVIYCEIYLAILVVGLSFLYFNNVRVFPHLPLSPLSSLSCILRLHSWFCATSFLTLAALWAKCLLSLLGNSAHRHFWEQTTLCISESAECCVSEHHLFIVLYGAFVGFCFFLSYRMKHLYCLCFETVQQLKLTTIKAKIRDQMKTSAVAVYNCIKYFYLFYYFFGFIPKWFVKSFLKQSFCDHDSLTSLCGLIDLKLLLTSCLVGFLVHASFAVTLSLVQVFLTERYSFPVETSFEEDNRLLTKAIYEPNNELLKCLSFQTLSFISQYSPACRQKIFAISIPGGHPHTWNLISSRCIEVIENFQYLLSEAAITTSCVPIPSTSQATTTTASVDSSEGSFMLSTPQRPLRAVGSPQLRATFKGRNMAEASASPQSYYTSKSVEPLIKFEKVFHMKAWLTQATRKAADNIMNKSWVKFFVLEQSERKLEKLFCSCHLVIWSIHGLCFLVRASFQEDRHGVVQWSLAKIISTLLNLQMAFEKTPKGLLRVSNSRDQCSLSLKGLCLKQSLRAALNSGLYHIACTFKQHMKYIELPEDHRNRMERYLQMKE